MRILYKFSGEALKSPESEKPFDRECLRHIAKEIRAVLFEFPDLELCVMPGGGNLGRGGELTRELGVDELTAHHAGMLYTLVNAIMFSSVLAPMLKEMGVAVRVMTAIEANAVAEPYLPHRARHHFANNRVLVFAAGSGRTHFSTDLAGANRAKELQCDLMLKGTKEEGVFDRDPRTNPDAKLIVRITPQEFLERQLTMIFDPEGIAYARSNNLPIRIFNAFGEGNLAKAIRGENVGTLIAD
ncbi:MAG: UMP kinase [Candidatus Vogelbacteria bacterium]|nr:UMP kinase [Candidatus Vogelbacteria bacterium]